MVEIIIPDQWLVARTRFVDETWDVVIRFRAYPATERGKAKYKTMFILKWWYAPKKDGMPRKADLAAMGTFENALEESIENPRVGIQAACLTGGGRRTWRYYAANPAKFRSTVAKLISGAPTAVELKEVDDPSWEGLGELQVLKECS